LVDVISTIAIALGCIFLVTIFVAVSVDFQIVVAFLLEKILEPLIRWFQRTFFGIDRIRSGAETLLGSTATAGRFSKAESAGFVGSVFIEGERWSARSDSPVEEGAAVSIIDREDLQLVVAPSDTGDR
jgi:membrane-bound ClpP family serine protease